MIITKQDKKYMKIEVDGNTHVYDIDYVEGYLVYEPEQEDAHDFDGIYREVSFGEYVLDDGTIPELLVQVDELPDEDIFWALEVEFFRLRE